MTKFCEQSAGVAQFGQSVWLLSTNTSRCKFFQLSNNW